MATEPTTTQEWNEAVIAALDMDTEYWVNDGAVKLFEPYGDKPENIATALWALERSADKNKTRFIVTYHGDMPGDPDYNYSCSVWKRHNQIFVASGPTACKVICRAIVGAAS